MNAGLVSGAIMETHSGGGGSSGGGGGGRKNARDARFSYPQQAYSHWKKKGGVNLVERMPSNINHAFNKMYVKH